ncbi:hypothetical protein EIP91_010256 [Steccherinum ochraceum]|uniref:N-acetyltransferase domain-containing protein n=1 Tax=Steccherinum ochraceum TaxID=92696 RepID=A0A4R0R654_9APHY|nr:hypothetical protein EIP91_010256 [Steccherinum ochraceum]
MSLSAQNIALHPISWRRPIITHIWEDYSTYSVEAITASSAGVYDFSENDCMYFAVIKLFEEVPAADQAEGVDPYSSASEDDTESWGPNSRLSHFVRGAPSGNTQKTITRESSIGVIYLTSSQLTGCVNLGCYLIPERRGAGYGRLAVQLVMGWAFEELGCHRVQVRLADGIIARRNRAVSTLLSLGFFGEGVSRRSLFCPSATKEEDAVGLGGEWRDVMTYAILDTDWVMQKGLTYLPPSFVKARWEELFRRHDRERSEVLILEERQERKAQMERALGKQIKRTTSTETIKDAPYKNMNVQEHDVNQVLQHFRQQNPSGSTSSLSTMDLEDPIAPNIEHTCQYTRQQGYSGSRNTPSTNQEEDPGAPEPVDDDDIDDVLQDILDGAQARDQTPSPLPHNKPHTAFYPAVQGHPNPFAFVPSSARFRSTSPSVSSTTYYNSEDDFNSTASSPLLPRSPLMRAHDSGSESDWEMGSMPRSPSVLSSDGSASSWDRWETSSEASAH